MMVSKVNPVNLSSDRRVNSSVEDRKINQWSPTTPRFPSTNHARSRRDRTRSPPTPPVEDFFDPYPVVCHRPGWLHDPPGSKEEIIFNTAGPFRG
jgi:hypothetical protein